MIVEIAERGAAYVRYRIGERPVGNTVEVGGEGSEVLVDMDSDGLVIGIEIVDVNVDENVARARAYATERGLAFPRDIVSAARSASAA